MRSQVSWFKRIQFGASARIEIYEMLGLLLDNREILIDALRTIRDVLNDTGKVGDAKREGELERDIDDIKPRNVGAEALHAWVMQLKSGDASGFVLSRAVRDWVPAEEAALIQAGEATGNLSRALADCVAGILIRGAMVEAVLKSTAYPLMLLSGAYGVMRLFALRVVPPFARQVDPSLWEGPARFLYIEVKLFNQLAVPGVTLAVLFLVLSVWSLPYYRGPGRVALDRWLPPWSIYKVIQGSTFLKNVAVQTRAGIILLDSVGGMLPLASPWLRQRLQAAMYGIEQGQNLGDALYNAEYDFPDRRSVQILRVLSTRDGFDETLYNFAKRWQEGTVKRVEKSSKMFMFIGVLVMGGVVGSCLLGIVSLSSMIEDHAESATSRAGI